MSKGHELTSLAAELGSAPDRCTPPVPWTYSVHFRHSVMARTQCCLPVLHMHGTMHSMTIRKAHAS